MKASTENVLVTGAGSGIGRELAKLFVADGARVWAVGLVERELDELKRELAASGDRLVTLPRDLSAPRRRQAADRNVRRGRIRNRCARQQRRFRDIRRLRRHGFRAS
jgi:NAD(P)-dependent dehydrogenase (short-subunit alcohol dehydrogenase family)